MGQTHPVVFLLCAFRFHAHVDASPMACPHAQDVLDNGAVAKWNAAAPPGRRIQANDHILSVNGVVRRMLGISGSGLPPCPIGGISACEAQCLQVALAFSRSASLSMHPAAAAGARTHACMVAVR